MKTLKLICIGMMFMISAPLQAQVSVNVNIGSPPPWGPVGYTEVRYYYLPDVEAYYDVHTSMFIYYLGGDWLHRTYLPARYSTYDLYSGYKVVLNDYHGTSPYSHFSSHKTKYAKGYRGKAQKTIGTKPGNGNSKAKAPAKAAPAKSSGKNSGKSAAPAKGGGHGNGKGHNN